MGDADHLMRRPAPSGDELGADVTKPIDDIPPPPPPHLRRRPPPEPEPSAPFDQDNEPEPESPPPPPPEPDPMPDDPPDDSPPSGRDQINDARRDLVDQLAEIGTSVSVAVLTGASRLLARIRKQPSE